MQTGADLNHAEARPPHDQDATVTPPPDLPAVPPRKALFIIAIVLLLLVAAGAVSMLSRVRAGRALARETERLRGHSSEWVEPLLLVNKTEPGQL